MTDGPSQGLNIAGQPSAYSDTFVAIDLMKGVDAWRYSDPTGPGADPHVPLSALRLDAKGWLKSLPVIDGVPQTVWGNIFYTQALPPGKYILEWQGEGSITTWTDHTQIAPNKLLVDFTANYINDQGDPKDDGVTVIVSATDPNHTGNYLRDITFYREQDADLIAAGEHFNPDWFNRVDDFRVLRTHDWQSTNFPNVVDWSRNNYAANQAV